MNGETIVDRGQRYTAIEAVPHVCRDGRETTLTRWLSWCATCGQPFTFTSPTSAKAFQPNRRCAKHKRPGAKTVRQCGRRSQGGHS